MTTQTLTIGQVADRAGVGVETIRFYEREGLIDKPKRRPSGYRQYDEEAVHHLRFIRRAKDLGFTLSEIKELLGLRWDPTARCDDVKQRAEEKINDIKEKVRTLNRMKRALVKLTEACDGQERTSRCPILEALDR